MRINYKESFDVSPIAGTRDYAPLEGLKDLCLDNPQTTPFRPVARLHPGRALYGDLQAGVGYRPATGCGPT